MSDPVVKLAHPLDDGTPTRVSQVTVRRPKVKDLLEVDRVLGETEKSVVLMASLTGLNRLIVEGMDASDFFSVMKVIATFLPQPPAGEPLSAT